MSTHTPGLTPGLKITFDGFGFNDAEDPYRRRLATLPATWKDEGARQQFGHEVVRAVNTHAQLLEALKALELYYRPRLGVHPVPHVIEQAQAAIAQAERKD